MVMNVLVHFPQWCLRSVPDLTRPYLTEPAEGFLVHVGGATIGSAIAGGATVKDEDGAPICESSKGGFLSVSLKMRKKKPLL